MKGPPFSYLAAAYTPSEKNHLGWAKERLVWIFQQICLGDSTKHVNRTSAEAKGTIWERETE